MEHQKASITPTAQRSALWDTTVLWDRQTLLRALRVDTGPLQAYLTFPVLVCAKLDTTVLLVVQL